MDRYPEHVIFHIDVNSAFLSWSALKMLREGSEIDLRTVPSIVGGDQETRHGIVTAKSIPAKVYGIKTADTVASALAKCPNLIVVKGDHHYYREQSHKLMDLLRSVCPVIEQVSVDECYMDFDPIRDRYESPEIAARQIADLVYETLEFTVNVGISDRKILAKMASDFQKPNKVHTLYSWEIEQKMWPLPIGELHMCGKSSADHLRRMGIRTIGDLANTDPKIVESWLKSHGRLLWESANGIDDSIVETEHAREKGVGNSTTYSHDLTTVEEAKPNLYELVQSVSTRLKKKKLLAGGLTVEIKYASFRKASHQKVLLKPTDTIRDLYPVACELFEECWDGEPVRLLGVRAGRVCEVDEPVQMDLFTYQKTVVQDEKQKKLSEAMAKLRNKFGDDVIRKGLD